MDEILRDLAAAARCERRDQSEQVDILRTCDPCLQQLCFPIREESRALIVGTVGLFPYISPLLSISPFHSLMAGRGPSHA